MPFSCFFRASWMGQLAVGIGLFAVSFLMQAQVIRGFMGGVFLALCLSFMLELGKVSAIVWHRYMVASRHAYPRSTRLASAGFRMGLLLLSVICSLLFLGNHLDRPLLEEARASDLAAIDSREKSLLEKLQTKRQQLLQSARDAYSMSLTAGPDSIRRLESLLLAEMDNTVKGQFKGPRYRELERRLEAEKQRQSEFLRQQDENLRSRFREIEAMIDNERNQIQLDAQKQRQAVLNGRYLTDERANDPRIVSFLNLVEELAGFRPSPMAFVLAFSALISLLLELGILLAFDTITIASAPVLRAQHEEQMNTGVYDSRLRESSKRSDMEHGSVMDRIRRRGESIKRHASRFSDELRPAACQAGSKDNIAEAGQAC